MLNDFNGYGNNNIIENPLDFGHALNANDANGAQTMKMRKLFMGRTRPHLNQHRRSIDVFMTGDGYNAIQEKIDRHGKKAFDTVNLSEVMAQTDIFKLSGTSEAQVSIDNGWDNERFMFVLVVDIYRNGRFARTEFISGHTDHTGAINTDLFSSVAVDPNMVFTINHVTEASIRNMDQFNNPVAMVSNTNSVITNNNYINFTNTANDLYMMRPSDVLKAVDKVDLHRGMQQANLDSGMNHTYRDLDSTLTNMPMMTNDTCNLIPTFTGRILNGLHNSKLAPNDPMNIDGMSNNDMASLLTKDTPFNRMGFVHIMNRHLANGVSTTSRFSFSDLLRLDATIDDRTSIFGRSYETGEISFPSAGNTNIMGAGETIAVHATHVVQTTLALMSIAGITTIAFNANNHSGTPVVTYQACEGMDYDKQLFRRMEVLRARLVMECLNMVSMDNNYLFNIDIFASAINDVFIQIQWNNEKREYIFPSFAHSVTLPTVTKDATRLTDVAERVTEIVDLLSSRESDHSNQYGEKSIFVGASGMNHVDVGNY